MKRETAMHLLWGLICLLTGLAFGHRWGVYAATPPMPEAWPMVDAGVFDLIPVPTGAMRRRNGVDWGLDFYPDGYDAGLETLCCYPNQAGTRTCITRDNRFRGSEFCDGGFHEDGGCR